MKLHGPENNIAFFAPDFSDIIDFFPDPCFAINPQGTIIAWNRALVDLTGIAAVDMIGKGNYEYAIPFYGVRRPVLIDLAIQWDEEIAKAYKYEKKYDGTLVSEIEHLIVGKKRHVLWNTARQICNTAGDCIGAIEAFRDASCLNKTESIRHRYDLLKEESRDIILFIDPDTGDILEANDAAVKAYGYSRSELLSLSITDIRKHSSRNLVADQMKKAVCKGILFETEHVRKDGAVFEVEVSSKGAMIDGNRILISIIRDITERKKMESALRDSEERFRLFMENSPTMSWIKDEQGRYTYVSKIAENLLKIGADEIIGKTDEELMPPEIAEQFNRNDRTAISAGRAVYFTEKFVEQDGKCRYWFNSKFPFQDSAGKQFVAGIGLDVTEQKFAQEELIRLNETLEQRVAERTQLAEKRAKQLQALAVELIEVEERERRRVAEILHEDLQQILAAARLQLQTARQKGASASLLIKVESLLEECIAKSRSLSHELSPVMLSHCGLVASLGWLIEQTKKQFDLDVRFTVSVSRRLKNAPVEIFLFRAVQELLFNVVKHAGVKEARVDLSEADDGLVLAVCDEGGGFDPEMLQSSTAKDGLGLASLRERTEAMGCDLTIESAPGRGCRFFLKVPTGLIREEPLMASNLRSRKTGNLASGGF